MSEPSRQLIESTLHTLREHRSQLQEQRDELDDRISRIDRDLREWEKALANSQGKQRRPKGANKQRVLDFLRQSSGRSFTIQEISENTEVAYSSVQAVLRRANESVEQTDDGRWRVRFKRQAKNETPVQPANPTPPPSTKQGQQDEPPDGDIPF
jgi:predicted DNA-binding protein YlxM (UPF0122 family)